MRALDAAQIARYLDIAGPAVLASVGAYQIEGLGAHLFETISGDYATILGLPMLKTSRRAARPWAPRAMSAIRRAGVCGWPVQPSSHSHAFVRQAQTCLLFQRVHRRNAAPEVNLNSR